MRLTSLCTAGLIVAASVGGCGDDETKTVTQTITPAATAPAETTPAETAPAETTPPSSAEVEATEETPDGEARKDSITVRGRTGDTLTLLGQYSTSVSGTPKARERVKVTLKGMRGPFSGFDPAAGNKLIGFDVRVTNVGKISFSDPLPSGVLILVGGESGKPTSLISGSGTNPCPNPSLKLKQGQSKQVCMAFEVPKNAKVQTLQYAVDSGYGDTALWRLR